MSSFSGLKVSCLIRVYGTVQDYVLVREGEPIPQLEREYPASESEHWCIAWTLELNQEEVKRFKEWIYFLSCNDPFEPFTWKLLDEKWVKFFIQPNVWLEEAFTVKVREGHNEADAIAELRYRFKVSESTAKLWLAKGKFYRFFPKPEGSYFWCRYGEEAEDDGSYGNAIMLAQLKKNWVVKKTRAPLDSV